MMAVTTAQMRARPRRGRRGKCKRREGGKAVECGCGIQGALKTGGVGIMLRQGNFVETCLLVFFQRAP